MIDTAYEEAEVGAERGEEFDSSPFGDLVIEVPGEPREIALLSQSLRLLAEARTLDEVKNIRDKSEAIRAYARQRNMGLEVQNAAAEIKIRAERRAGELLKAMPKQKPGEYQRSHGESVAPKISDLGIDHNQSYRWQRLASIPEETFEQHIQETKAASKELTSAGVHRIATPPEPTEPEPRTLQDAIHDLASKLYVISERWPEPYIEAMGHQLISLGEELLKHGSLRECT